ncbi:N-acetylmuramoyl-L-alanine amidase [Solirubrobacter soli]|uniref:N-acetylmuramoyl-L-alanine amidase n=1 Tax=Solirubrobacter soli TaxID=363832 RepID=UPI0004136777|nr:N-acetylmuramoyl-L-alanine amidase [Solirubrobacter soli]
MDGHRLTRRQAVRLGAGVVALGALRVPSPALGAEPALFELALPDAKAHAAAVWRTTDVLTAPRRFDLAGLRWSRATAYRAQIRTRARGGRWTRWTPLPASHGTLKGTDPIYTGAADELQLRSRGSATGLTLRFVKTTPQPTRRARAAQATGAPPMVPRADWGADQVPPRTGPSYGVVEAAFVHHTVTAVDYAPDQSAGIVLGIARYHRDSNGWNDIGYNFLVDRYGVIFEGRAGGVEAAVIGAQAQGWNSVSTGIACLGTFTNIPLDAPAMESLAKLIGWKLSLHGVPVQGTVTLQSGGGESNRYPYGELVDFQRISGHRDGCETSCPGEQLYAQLPALRSRAAAFSHPVSAITVKASSQKGAKPTSVSGVLRFADGSSPAGAALGVEYMAAGSAWTQVTTTTCGVDGNWSTSVQLPASGQVRAVFAGDATRTRLESAPVAVKVVPSMSLTSDKRRAKAGTAFAISGTLAPGQALVQCLLERQVGNRWVTVQRKRIGASSGRFQTKVRPKKAGLYRVSIIAAGVTRRRTLRALH